jgi:hypothetical protein
MDCAPDAFLRESKDREGPCAEPHFRTRPAVRLRDNRGVCKLVISYFVKYLAM